MKFIVNINYHDTERIELPFVPSIGMTIAYSIQKEWGVEYRVVKILDVEFNTSCCEFFVEVDKNWK